MAAHLVHVYSCPAVRDLEGVEARKAQLLEDTLAILRPVIRSLTLLEEAVAQEVGDVSEPHVLPSPLPLEPPESDSR